MTTHDAATTDTATWPQPGDEVVIITFVPGSRKRLAQSAKVGRLTATAIVLEPESFRFRRDDLRGKGEETWGHSRHLVKPDSREALETFAQQVRDRGAKRAAKLLMDWHSTDDLRGEDVLLEVRALLDGVETRVANLLNRIPDKDGAPE